MDVIKTTIDPANRQAQVGGTVTFDIDIHNIGTLDIDILPLIDYYDTYCYEYVSASETPTAVAYGLDGVLHLFDESTGAWMRRR